MNATKELVKELAVEPGGWLMAAFSGFAMCIVGAVVFALIAGASKTYSVIDCEWNPNSQRCNLLYEREHGPPITDRYFEATPYGWKEVYTKPALPKLSETEAAK